MIRNERGLLRRLLEFAQIHILFKKISNGKHQNNEVIMRIIDASDKRILDLGCGTAEILGDIANDKSYVGIDYNQKYIESASLRYRDRPEAEFYCTDLNSYAKNCNRKFDIVMMLGVLHHMSDSDVDDAMKSIQDLLADDGCFISLDCCFTKPMNPIAWILCSLDRGKYVRRKNEWIALMNRYWSYIWYEVRTDTLAVPYSVIIFKNRNQCDD